MNIPNTLTILRLVLVPVYIAVYFCTGEPKTAACAVFVAASITDVLDGFIARKFHMSTKTGQLLDPLADKLMQIAVVVTMLIDRRLPLWFVLFLGIKELFMILGGIFLYSKQTFVKSNFAGKLNTVAVFCAMVVIMLIPNANLLVKNAMLTIVLITNATAIATYFYLYFLQQKKFKAFFAKNNNGGEQI